MKNAVMKNAKANPYGVDLMEAVGKGLDAGTIRRLATVLQSSGLWSPADPVDDEGRPLANAWLKKLRCTHGHYSDDGVSLPDDTVLTWLLTGCPADQLWLSDKRPSVAVLDKEILDSLLSPRSAALSYKASPLWSPVLWRSFPERTLMDYGSGRYDRCHAGQAVLSRVVDCDQVDVVKVLFERGWRWESTQDTPPGAGIKSTRMWEFFLASGGDPDQPIQDNGIGHENGRETTRTLPLWRYLLQKQVLGSGGGRGHDPTLRQALRDWSAEHRADGLQSVDMERYWKGLTRSYNIADTLKAIRSIKEWPHLRNDHGQSPLMVVMDNDSGPGVIEALADNKRARSALAAVDAQGRSLWHYLLANGSNHEKVTTKTWKVLLDAADPQPDVDEGLLPLLIKSGGHFFREYRFGADAALAAIDTMKFDMSSAAWWGGSHRAQDRLAAYLVSSECIIGHLPAHTKKSSPISGFRRKVSDILACYPLPPGASPALHAALAANELLVVSDRETSNQRSGYAMFDQLIGGVVGQGVMAAPFAPEFESTAALRVDGPRWRALLHTLNMSAQLLPDVSPSRNDNTSRHRPRM